MDRTSQLEMEKAKGEEYERVFTGYIAPFIEEKQKVLFEAFTAANATDTVTLQAIKMQASAINALAASFQEFINTGKLAKFELESKL